jgi:hypothetical protein
MVLIHQNDDDNLHVQPPPNLIVEIEDDSIANVLCFSAFADKVLGIMYNNCMDDFLYMLLHNNVYHYKINTILMTPVAGLNSKYIWEAYKKNFKFLVSKGFKPIVNVMGNNQATKDIKAYLTPQQVTIRLVEPQNHWGNAAEQAIQIFKNRFIGALNTTNSK